MLLFLKVIDETQMVKPPEPTSHHNSKKYLILLPLRAIYFRSLYYETPCMMILLNSQLGLLGCLGTKGVINIGQMGQIDNFFIFLFFALQLEGNRYKVPL